MPMPPSSLVAEWKSKYDEVFTIQVGGALIAYRSITFREFDQIVQSQSADSSSVDIEDDLVNLAVLWPETLELTRAGHITAIADAIKESSCLDGEVYRAKEVLDTWRARASGIRGEMYSFVMFAMPQYKASDLDNLTFYRLSELVALAEKVITLRQAAEGIQSDRPVRLELYTPEEIDALNSRKISDGGNATVVDPIAQKLRASM